MGTNKVARLRKELWSEYERVAQWSTPIMPGLSVDRYNVDEQDTLPLNLMYIQSAINFQGYLRAHRLDPLTVARVSGVRYLTIWNIQQGKPIRKEHAHIVRRGLHRLTGEVYAAGIAVYGEEGKGKTL
ncbi:MAG TPA: hypothetical protein VKR06_19020 [Ktedonosporobacter sp.]|nr:hypothetical protein [Ktedonosporobacter sp.]